MIDKLSKEGRKIWDRPFHPNRTEAMKTGEVCDIEGGISYGQWLVGRIAIQGVWVTGDEQDRANYSINHAIATCNALAEMERHEVDKTNKILDHDHHLKTYGSSNYCRHPDCDYSEVI